MLNKPLPIGKCLRSSISDQVFVVGGGGGGGVALGLWILYIFICIFSKKNKVGDQHLLKPAAGSPLCGPFICGHGDRLVLSDRASLGEAGCWSQPCADGGREGL